MSQPLPNNAPPETAPEQDEAPQTEPNTVPELEAYCEEELDVLFDHLQGPAAK